MFRKLFFTLLVTLFFATACHGGLIKSGNLVWGATDINIEGHLYDFEFFDGRCTDGFTGCDEPSDFAFNTQEKAVAASLALIDVIGGEELGGCGFFCLILTPYQSSIWLPDPRRIVLFSYVNLSQGSNSVSINSLYTDYGISVTEGMVWGLWTHQRYIPEPGSLILLMMGLISIYFSRRSSI